MFQIIRYTAVFLVVFDVIPHRISSIPLSQVLQLPTTTVESHISNFLHQHRTDSRADKPVEHPGNARDSLQHRHTTTTSTEAPLTQTEFLTNILHNVIHDVREQFPDLINAISAPRASSKPPHHLKRLIKHHTALNRRSANVTSEENTTEFEGLSLDEDSEDPEEVGSSNNMPSFIPQSLIKVVLEASGNIAAHGSASASAGSIASSSGSSSSSSSGIVNGRISNEDENQNSALGHFLLAKFHHKARALASLVIAPLIGAYTFVQRAIGAVSESSSFPIPSGPTFFPEPDEPDLPNSDGHQHHLKNDHYPEGHSHNSTEHDHQRSENVTTAEGVTHLVGGDDVKESLHKLAFRNAFFKYTNLMTNGIFNETSDDLITENPDGPLHVVLDHGGLDYDQDNSAAIDPLQD